MPADARHERIGGGDLLHWLLPRKPDGESHCASPHVWPIVWVTTRPAKGQNRLRCNSAGKSERFAPADAAIARLQIEAASSNAARQIRRGELNGQTLATFSAACVDNSATTACFHANQKTVGASAACFGGLVSTFHVLIPNPKSLSQ